MMSGSLCLFDECPPECIHLCPQEEYSVPLFSEGTIKCTRLAPNSQRTPTKINKNGAISKVSVLVEQVILEGI